jgi:LmbE family N-acetylglucosaminyl deacetylase
VGLARRAAHRLARTLLPGVPPAVREVALALAARAGTGPAVLPGAPPGPVLVVAPHPDDETIGCGGALARHAAAGDRVTVVVATSGGATRGGGRDVEAERERECRAACAALGVGEPVFLRLPDGGLSAAVPRLAGELARLGAGAAVAYAPALLDPHPDHRAANLALAAAGLPAEVLGYEVWSPAAADVVLDVGGVWDRKEGALRCYPVALESVDYVAACAGLAAYRGATAGLGPGARAEAFVRLAAAEHADLVARLTAPAGRPR